MMELPSVKDLQAKIAAAEAAKASAAMKAQAAEEAEKRALHERLTKPSGLSDAEVMEKASIIINRAVENGLMSVEVFRFPHDLCTDNGRAINQAEAGWEGTLTGIPRELLEFWRRQLKPRGYHIHYQILDFPHGMPGDVVVILSWS